MNGTQKTMKTEYRTWLDAKQERIAAGDIAEYLDWYLDNPSPMGGLSGRKFSRRELIRNAVESVALSFKGTEAEVRHTATPEASAQIVSIVTGQILGHGYIAEGNQTQDAILIQGEHSIVAIPSRNVIGIENKS